LRKIGVKMEGRGFACGKRRFARQGASGVLQLAPLNSYPSGLLGCGVLQ